MARPVPVDAVVVGGGPAGSSAARLLAAWGHSVVVLDNPAPRDRGLAESIPPSTRKLLAEIGALEALDAAPFVRSTGNTAWWASDASTGSGQARVETFGPAAFGYQVFRPEFDRVLIEGARSAGADVRTPARVGGVEFGDDSARIDYEVGGRKETLLARTVVDGSGRTGVVGRRVRCPQRGHRTYALVGVWERSAWDLPDDTHTLVETYDDGWAWSVPVSATTRHVGVMVDSGRHYLAEIAKTWHTRRTLEGAALRHDWACDASLYFASRYAGPRFMLAGDAGSFIDPLSSFGVKKALASAWMSAVVTHTILEHPEREAAALAFFEEWERDVYATHLRRSRDFARAACGAHPGAFWKARAEVEIEEDAQDSKAAQDFSPATAALKGCTTSDALDFVMSPDVRFEPRPVIRGREIVIEPAFEGGLRFVEHVDLVTLADIACRHRRVPDLFDAYCRTCPPAPLPNVMGGLSLLVARGILHERS